MKKLPSIRTYLFSEVRKPISLRKEAQITVQESMQTRIINPQNSQSPYLLKPHLVVPSAFTITERIAKSNLRTAEQKIQHYKKHMPKETGTKRNILNWHKKKEERQVIRSGSLLTKERHVQLLSQSIESMGLNTKIAFPSPPKENKKILAYAQCIEKKRIATLKEAMNLAYCMDNDRISPSKKEATITKINILLDEANRASDILSSMCIDTFSCEYHTPIVGGLIYTQYADEIARDPQLYAEVDKNDTATIKEKTRQIIDSMVNNVPITRHTQFELEPYVPLRHTLTPQDSIMKGALRDATKRMSDYKK